MWYDITTLTLFPVLKIEKEKENQKKMKWERE